MKAKKRVKNWYEKAELKFVDCCYNCDHTASDSIGGDLCCMNENNNTKSSLDEGGRSIEANNICKYYKEYKD